MITAHELRKIPVGFTPTQNDIKDVECIIRRYHDHEGQTFAPSVSLKPNMVAYLESKGYKVTLNESPYSPKTYRIDWTEPNIIKSDIAQHQIL